MTNLRSLSFRSYWVLASLALLLICGSFYATAQRGPGYLLKSSVSSTVSLRQVARIPIISDAPSGSSVQKVAWNSDGSRLAMSLGWGYEMIVLDASTWREVSRVRWKTFQPERDITFISNTEIVTMPADNDVASPKALAVYDSETGGLIREIPRPPQYANKFAHAVAATWNGRFIAAVMGLSDPALFETKSDRFIGPPGTPAGTRSHKIAGGPDSKFAMNVVHQGTGAQVRKEIYIVDATSNTVDRVLDGHVPGIESIAWSPDGRMVASGASMLRAANDGKWIRDPDPIRVWDVKTGNTTVSFSGFYDPIAEIAWHPSSSLIATISAKGGEGERGSAIRIWSLARSAMVFEHKAAGSSVISGLSFRPKIGQILWGEGGALHVFEVVKQP